MHLLTERYRERLAGVLSCYDRIIVTGTLPGACCRRKIEMSPGVQSRDDTPVGEGTSGATWTASLQCG